jgi:3-oxoacyl-[acyl-carrier-protein] synthase-1
MSLVVTGIGMRTSVGQNAVQSCAAIRAGINRFGEWPCMASPTDADGGPVIGAAVVPLLGNGSWMEKFFELATQPFLEVLWHADLGEAVGHDRPPRWGVFLGVPHDTRPGVEEAEAAEFRQAAAERDLFPVCPAKMELFPHGHAAGLLALEKAAQSLEQGEIDFAVVGGVDSLLHGPCLYWLQTERKLKHSENPAGLIPGEAAAFIVVESERYARGRGANVLARLAPVHTGRESVPAGKPTSADALTQVTRALFDSLPADRRNVLRVVLDLNGESWRFFEWSLADTRNPPPAPTFRQLWHPADCLGDVGAATGPALLAVAARAFERGYAVGDALPVITSSDPGERAATAVLPANPNGTH